ncbi:MAG: DUF6527 family protein [Rhodospirillaceae bacterium]|nr:DUF6527 family protein [Rhodospirillaceae bacterium]
MNDKPTPFKIKYREFTHNDKKFGAYFVYCPACKRAHRLITYNEADPKHQWTFDGNLEAPTFDPSLKVESGPGRPGERNEICHSYIIAGVWQFAGDSTHEMAGQHVPMVDFPSNYRV